VAGHAWQQRQPSFQHGPLCRRLLLFHAFTINSSHYKQLTSHERKKDLSIEKRTCCRVKVGLNFGSEESSQIRAFKWLGMPGRDVSRACNKARSAAVPFSFCLRISRLSASPKLLPRRGEECWLDRGLGIRDGVLGLAPEMPVPTTPLCVVLTWGRMIDG
jgi:hypothetical protein